MQRTDPLKQDLAVVDDLSRDEQRYLYRKTQEIKNAVRSGSDPSPYRIADRDYQAYLVFLENSTRTRESFRNAAEFHGCRVNMFDAATSSFAKNESLTDAVKMRGYGTESCFVIRSAWKGSAAPWNPRGDLLRVRGFPRPHF